MDMSNNVSHPFPCVFLDANWFPVAFLALLGLFCWILSIYLLTTMVQWTGPTLFTCSLPLNFLGHNKCLDSNTLLLSLYARAVFFSCIFFGRYGFKYVCVIIPFPDLNSNSFLFCFCFACFCLEYWNFPIFWYLSFLKIHVFPLKMKYTVATFVNHVDAKSWCGWVR